MTRFLALLATAALLAACADSPHPLAPDGARDLALAPPSAPPSLALVASSLSPVDLPAPATAFGAWHDVRGMNESGWVVGTTFAGFEPATWYGSKRAVLWKGTTPIVLEPLEPEHPSRGHFGRDVNDAGVVAGYGSMDVPDVGLRSRPFLWKEGEGFTMLPLPAATTENVGVNAINNLGQAAGWVQSAAGRALVWTDPTQPPVDLGTLGGSWAEASDINDAGMATGVVSIAGVTRSFVWTEAAGATVLPFDGAHAVAINAHGAIVGTVWHDGGEPRAFRWSAAAGFEELGVPPGGHSSMAFAINDQGHIAATVTYLDEYGNTTSRAHLWADGSWVDIAGSEEFTDARTINEQQQVAGSRTQLGVNADRAIRWTVTLAEEVPPFTFTGFFPPVENAPAVNRAQAGRAIPVKFSLGGDQGLDIFAPGYPLAQSIACDSGAPLASVEETVTAGASGLQYDAGTQRYTYVWKTQRSWSGRCRRLVVRLVDGTERHADFSFR